MAHRNPRWLLPSLQNQNLIAEMAAVSGISANFSSGDYGDFTSLGLSPTVSSPADGTYATAIGGVTVALNPDYSIAWQSGWGNDEGLLAEPGFIFNPPLDFGFVYGAGGGPSSEFAKPSFQKGVPGTARQLPDISWVADPFTGVVVLISEPAQFPSQVWYAWGAPAYRAPCSPLFGRLPTRRPAWLWGKPPLSLLHARGNHYRHRSGGLRHQRNREHSRHQLNGNTSRAGQVLGGATRGKFYSALWDDPYRGRRSLCDFVRHGLHHRERRIWHAVHRL